MSGSFSRCDGQLASGDENHNVGVVSVRRVNRHEARHAVDVAADAGVDAVEGYVLCVGVHGQSSALDVQWPLIKFGTVKDPLGYQATPEAPVLIDVTAKFTAASPLYQLPDAPLFGE